MTQPRSANIAAVAMTAPGTVVLATCPANHSIILKSVYVSTGAATSGTVAIAVGPTTPAANVILLTQSIGNAQVARWEGWVVLEPNQYVLINSALSQTQVWVSGSVLQGVPVDTPALSTPGVLPAGLLP